MSGPDRIAIAGIDLDRLGAELPEPTVALGGPDHAGNLVSGA
jgi:hypothetical protein